MSSCEKPSLESQAPAATTTRVDQQLKDQEKKGNSKNPFTVTNMREAYARLIADPCLDCPTTQPPPVVVLDPAPPVEATHLYVRFKPANTDQLADLDDLGFRLSWQPYDESVAAGTTVDFTADAIPWIYTVVPVGTGLPSYIQQEVIDQLFLFSTEDGDVRDADPWQPTPTPCDPRYLWCPPVTVGRVAADPTINKQAEATKKLKKTKVSPRALYDEAMRISGHSDELLAPSAPVQGLTSTPVPTQNLFGTRYHPKGQIKVQDTDLGAVPLRGVRVKSRRWFNFDETYTDNQGNFSIGSGYLSLVKISLEFKSDLATTRGIVATFKPWQAVLPISSDLSDYSKGDMERIAYTVTYQGGLDKLGSKGASTWTAATLFNTLADEQDLSRARGIPAPVRDINVWLLPDFPPKGLAAGSTPMLRKIASTSIASPMIDLLLIGSGLGELFLIKQILQRQLPDMLIRYGDDGGARDTPHLQALLYHELGHVQHYGQVGNSFWLAFDAQTVKHRGYGQKSDAGSGRFAICEGWGNYTERLFTVDKYQGTSASARARRAQFELEYQIPNESNQIYLGDYTQGWLIFGLYYDMTDSTPEPTSVTTVTDNVTAFNTAMVFRGLQPDVLTPRDYQQRINAQNNNLQAAQLEQLVTSYRW